MNTIIIIIVLKHDLEDQCKAREGQQLTKIKKKIKSTLFRQNKTKKKKWILTCTHWLTLIFDKVRLD